MSPSRRGTERINPSVYARDTFGGGTQLQVVADGEKDDVAREAMAGHQARRLTGRVSATRTAGANGTATLIMAIASQVGRRAVGAGRHPRSLPELLIPRLRRRTTAR